MKYMNFTKRLTIKRKEAYFKPSWWPGANTDEYFLLPPSLDINICIITQYISG
jgi:hypothetical protein